MKIDTTIETRNGRIYVRLETSRFTAQEGQLLQQFGDPLVEVGGTFSGTITVPNHQATTLQLRETSAGVVVPAEASPVLNTATGAVVLGVVMNPGEGYPTAPDVLVSGDGTGAVLTATVGVEEGTGKTIVTGLTVVNGGTGYHDVPWVGTFQLPTAQRRLQADFPIQRVFDTADFADAEAMALCWASTLQTRMTFAIQTLRSTLPAIDGETGITV